MGSGNCSFWAPGVFDLDDEGIAIVTDPTGAPRTRSSSPPRVARRRPSPSCATARRSSEAARHGTPPRPDGGVIFVGRSAHADRDHRRARRAGHRRPPLRRGERALRGRAHRRRRRTRRAPADSGSSSARSAGPASTFPRRSVARATERSSSRSCSRSSAGGACPVRSCPPCSPAWCSPRRPTGRPRRRSFPTSPAAERVATVALTGALVAEAVPGGLRLTGSLEPVLSASLADVALVPVDRGDGAPVWCALELDDAAVTVVEQESVDLTRRAGRIDVDGAVVALDDALAAVTAERVHDLAAVLLAAEAIGVAQWCVDTASEYAKERVQFGRPIGQFQAVKHRCAEMLARTELARAAVWDAARAVDDESENGGPLAVAGAASLALDAAFENAKDCVQTLGGIGFTWEHDAHLYLRRAITLHQLDVSPGRWRQRAASLVLAGVRRRLSVDVGSDADAERLRSDLRAFLDELAPLDAQARRDRLVDEGYITPVVAEAVGTRRVGARAARDRGGVPRREDRAAGDHGRRVGAAEPHRLRHARAAGALDHADAAGRDDLVPALQRAGRGIRPRRALDARSASTAAGSSTVRRCGRRWRRKRAGASCSRAPTPSGPSTTASRASWSTCTSPGIDIRPLRELTGHAMFNEVFFDDVFVPDDCLVGEEHDGWRCARTTLANERVYMGSSNTIGGGVVGVLRELERQGLTDDTAALEAAGGASPRPATRSRCSATASRWPRCAAPTRRVRRRPCASCSACCTTSGCRSSGCASAARAR